MEKIDSSAPSSTPRFSRRDLLRAGVAAGAAAAAGATAAARVAQAEDEWEQYYDDDSGATVNYPDSWFLVTYPVGNLILPHQAFGISDRELEGFRLTNLPDLRTAPADSVYVWLQFDDAIQEDSGPKTASSVAEMTEVPSEFRQFSAHLLGFTGSSRSFTLRVWMGLGASPQTRETVDNIIASISVP